MSGFMRGLRAGCPQPATKKGGKTAPLTRLCRAVSASSLAFGLALLGGRRLGVKVKTIRAWENDQSEPRANKLQMLAGMLGVSIMWLLSGAGDGLDGPEDRTELSEDLAELLKELRRIKVDQARMSERMGRLEKRLRLALSQGV